jgi:hypothetical protein
MTLKFYNKLINSLEKVETVTHEEKLDKADAIVAITAIIAKRGGAVVWNKTKWKVTEAAQSPYELTSEDTIHVAGSGGVKLNEKIRQEDLHEYSIIHRKSFIEELIRWITEARNSSDKMLMQEDLKMLMDVEDDYIFSSNSTNSYITKSDSEFEETCKELIELNKTL